LFVQFLNNEEIIIIPDLLNDNYYTF